MIKKMLTLAAFAALCPSADAADVGVSISVGHPNFYGQINIGNAPPPQVIYSKPVIIQPARVVQEPMYVRVPPGHERNWRHHCREYNACGRPVYFVHENWYRRAYPEHFHGYDRDHRHERNENWRDHDRRNDRDEGWRDRDHDRGHHQHRD